MNRYSPALQLKALETSEGEFTGYASVFGVVVGTTVGVGLEHATAISAMRAGSASRARFFRRRFCIQTIIPG